MTSDICSFSNHRVLPPAWTPLVPSPHPRSSSPKAWRSLSFLQPFCPPEELVLLGMLCPHGSPPVEPGISLYRARDTRSSSRAVGVPEEILHASDSPAQLCETWARTGAQWITARWKWVLPSPCTVLCMAVKYMPNSFACCYVSKTD